MTLNISKLRRLEENATPGPWDSDTIAMIDTLEDEFFIIDSRNHFRQLLDIVEAAAEYKKSMDDADNDNSSAAMSKIGQSVDDLWELLEDVEVDDE